MKRINVWRGQAPRGIRTVNTTGFGGIVLVPTILMVLLLGAVLIACPEAGSSSGGGSQTTVETIARANNGITAKWQASAGASGYIVTVTNEKGDVVVRKSVASVTDKNDYELDIDQLPKGTHKVSISTKENPDAAIATSKEISISTEPIVAVYKAHVSADNSAHRDKFSLGDYNDPGLLKIAGLKDGSKAQYEIKVSAGSTSIYTLAKKQITEAVPSSGENKGIIYVGLEMNGATWRGIAPNSEVTITLTVYDDAGTTEFFSETVTAKKSPNGSIYSWRGLQNMQDDLSENYKLENDIEFPEPNTKGFVQFTPIGLTATSPFTGTLDGNNKKVSELYIDHDARYAGLFGYVKAKTKATVVVKDLTLAEAQVTSTLDDVGALVGRIHTGTVSNVHVQGGRVTQVSAGTVKFPNAGGLVGAVDSNGVVSSSSSSAQVIGPTQIGGLVGGNSGTLTGYATGAVSGETSGAGGLVGLNTGTLTGYATGAVSVSSVSAGVSEGKVGGLVGTNYGGTVTGYATGTVSGDEDVGGLVGVNAGTGTITGYATGAVSASNSVGGLVGYNFTAGKATGYALGYVIKKDATSTSVGHGIGTVQGTPTVKVYVGRTSEEAEKTAGAGDHVGVIATETPKSGVTKSDGAAPQGIVIEGSGRNVAADTTTTPPIVAKLYSKNEASFADFAFSSKAGEWTLGANNWPILNFAADFADGARTQDPKIPAKPTNFHE